MKKMLLPVAMGLVGLLGGAGAGWMLKPPAPPADPCLGADGLHVGEEACAKILEEQRLEAMAKAHEGNDKSEFVPLERQFIVPVVRQDRVAAMMVLTLGVEVAPGKVETVLRAEPKVRDALLRTLFAHAYSGGFEGDFTAAHVMRDLRRNMLIAVREVVGLDARNVLVQDIVKQAQ